MTKANSSNAPKTNVRQTPVQTSIALVYDTGGSDAFMPEVCVAIVRRVVTPRSGWECAKNDELYNICYENILPKETRAGTAP